MERVVSAAGRLRDLPYQMLPQLRASNGPVYIHPDDRKYGVLAVGGQGSGKTALLLRLYLSDIRDPDASPIVVDPKSELARLCLEMTPPDCGKRVWYLDLGRPMFGMSPLRRDPARTLPEQASAIADNIVQAISDTAEGQVFQSSRRYLYHAVIGALALANKQGGLAMFEDVFALLLPARNDLREAAVNACQEFADLDHTTEFFRVTLPDELDANRSNTYQRLDPPRNKIETILASPSLRRFYNHPTDIRLADIVRARDILIVDANMAALGENNAQVVMHLFFQQLHALMQEQVHIPSHERPRVPTIWDEGGYVASMNTIKQAATHREAGLEVAMGIQYISQLGAKAESATVTEAIRKGATNLLQSRCLFRLSDPEDAETQTRVAMSVYQTGIRADLDVPRADGHHTRGVDLPAELVLPRVADRQRRASRAVLRRNVRVQEAARRAVGRTPHAAAGAGRGALPGADAEDLQASRQLHRRRRGRAAAGEHQDATGSARAESETAARRRAPTAARPGARDRSPRRRWRPARAPAAALRRAPGRRPADAPSRAARSQPPPDSG